MVSCKRTNLSGLQSLLHPSLRRGWPRVVLMSCDSKSEYYLRNGGGMSLV